MPDKCPTCDRKFERLEDFPVVYVAKVSFVRPEKVPDAVSDEGILYKEELLERKKKGWKGEIVPAEVLAYYRAHPNEEEIAHSDGFVYSIPLEDTREFRQSSSDKMPRSRGPKLWTRNRNYAPRIRLLMEQNQPLRRYFQSLERLIEEEVPPSRLLPEGDVTDFGTGLGLRLYDAQRKIKGYRASQIYFSLYRSRSARGIFRAGLILYAGRVHQK